MGQGSIIGYEINEKTCQISFYNDKISGSPFVIRIVFS